MDIINTNNNLICYLHKHDNEINCGRAMAALIIRAGSNNEGADEQGISHFLEHMNVHLMPWFPSVKEENLELIRYAYTNFNETVYVFMNQFIENENYFITGCINTMKHILNRDFLSEAIMPYVREEVQKEYEATDFSKAAALRRLFPSEPTNVILPIGKIDCIKRFTYYDIMTHHNKLYLPENAAVVILSSLNIQQTAGIIKEAFSVHLENEHVIKSLIQKAVTKQGHSHADMKNCTYIEDDSGIYFLSKTKREWFCLSKHIEDGLCIHLAIDSIKLAVRNYLEGRDITAFDINGSVEIFSHDWYIVRLDILFKIDTGIHKWNLEQYIKSMKLEMGIFNQVKMDFMRLVETRPKYDALQLLGEYIQHYLYNEPILDFDDEIKHIYQAIHKINYDLVRERFHEIINYLTAI